MRDYTSKAANYSIDLRVQDLRSIAETQRDNVGDDEYMRGMYNGLALAWTIIAEPYGAEPEYFPSRQTEPTPSTNHPEQGEV